MKSLILSAVVLALTATCAEAGPFRRGSSSCGSASQQTAACGQQQSTAACAPAQTVALTVSYPHVPVTITQPPVTAAATQTACDPAPQQSVSRRRLFRR